MRQHSTRPTLLVALVVSLAVVAWLLPVASPGGSPDASAAGPVTAVDDVVTAAESVSTTIDPLANDTLARPAARLRIVEPPSSGTLRLDPANTLKLTYRSEPGFLGQVQASYTFTDDDGRSPATPGRITLTVVPRPPAVVDDQVAAFSGRERIVDVLANDTDPYSQPLVVTAVTQPAQGTAAIAADGRSVSYTSYPGYVGADSLTYTVTAPSGASATGTVSLTVGVGPALTLNAAPVVVALRTYVLTGTLAGVSTEGVTLALRTRVGDTWTPAPMPITLGADGALRWTYAPIREESLTWSVLATWPDGTTATSNEIASVSIARPDILVSGPLGRAAVPYSYRAGCPVAPGRLRRMSLNYWNYSGGLSRGTVIVASWAVADLRHVFTSAFAARFRIASLTPVDAYYAAGRRSPTQSDIAAMAAGNTSAFNCRSVTGNKYRLSQHSFGDAIDINPFQNPYVTRSRVYPPTAKTRYVIHRARYIRDSGVITRDGALARAMAQRKWRWGARWSNPDYQHFSRNGG